MVINSDWFSHSKLVGINNRNSDCLSISTVYYISFLWKHDTFLAVYCTLLNNSYLGIYLWKTTTQKTGKKRKKEKKIRY